MDRKQYLKDLRMIEKELIEAFEKAYCSVDSEEAVEVIEKLEDLVFNKIAEDYSK